MKTQPQVLPSDAPNPEGRPSLNFAAKRRGKPPRHFVDLSAEEKIALLAEHGVPAFRAKQIGTHYFDHLSISPQEMTDLPAEMREKIVPELLPELVKETHRLTADDGATLKTLWSLYDGVKVESVLMGYRERVTLCVSSQAGCGMACPFCATGQMGLTRNLSVAEILEQVRLTAQIARNGELSIGPDRLTNVVFMGMGEPLANYKSVMAAVRAMVADPPEGFGLSARNVTVSTVGLVPAINKLAKEGIPVTLALSLHAPDDQLRGELIPINSRWTVGEALDAARGYFDATGRRVSIEYALIKDMNDHGWRADLLGEELNKRGKGWAHVNPIPLNPTPGSIWTASEKDVETEFVNRLRATGVSTTVRDTRGSDIDGACGQLATSTAAREGVAE